MAIGACQPKTFVLETLRVVAATKGAKESETTLKRLEYQGEYSTMGCQHMYVHRICKEDIYRYNIGDKVKDQLCIDYSIPGASEHHPIPSGT